MARLRVPRCLWRTLGPSCALLLLTPTLARCGPDAGRASLETLHGKTGSAQIADSTRVDDDRQPIRRPPDWDLTYWGRRAHQGAVEPVVHVFDVPDKILWAARTLGASTRREAVDVNAFDEVPNSTWFTNRNHVRAVPLAEMRQGPDSVYLPAKPWVIKHAKVGGWSPGFEIKDANGKKWLVKLDTRGYPELSSGADMVARTLVHAAGYNVPHNESVRFRRSDVTIAADLLHGPPGKQFSEADLDSILAQGALLTDGSFVASASAWLPGHMLGSPSMSRPRPGDSNDWYAHTNRRELRGLFVVCAWIDDWDTEDHQFVDAFETTRDSLGYVEHYLLDVGSSFGASAVGPKQLWEGYENAVDFAWIGRRFATLGFVEEPWRRAHQETGIPAIGSFESAAFRPEDFRSLVAQPAFRMMTDRDGYWGAKIVASFSDAQITAAVESAHYEDPRASDCLVRNMIVRRDKIARHWFGRVAPLDFFVVEQDTLQFNDLAVDLGLDGARTYDVEVVSTSGGESHQGHVHLDGAAMSLGDLGAGVSHVSLEISVRGNRARPTHVELARVDSRWSVSRVRHG